MSEETLPTEAFANFFKECIGQLEQIYKWRIGPNAKRTFEDFRLDTFQWS